MTSTSAQRKNVQRASAWTPFVCSISAMVMMVMVMVMMMMMMPVRSWADPDVNAGAMVMMVMMVVTDHNLGGSDAAALRQPFIVGF